MSNSRVRLGVLVSHPIQYFCPVYRALAADPTIDLLVVYRTRVGVDAYHDVGFGQTVRWDIPLLAGYPHRFLSAKTVLEGLELNVIDELIRQRFSVLLVHGYNSPTNLLAILVAKLCGTKVLLRGDTRLGAHHQQAPFKRVLKRALFGLIDGFVCIGSLNRAYYVAHGVPEHRLLFAPFSVDNAFFALPVVERAAARSRLRSAWGLPVDAVGVLSVSKLIPLKRVDDLIRAFAAVQGRAPQAWLIIAGSGPDAEALQTLAEELHVTRICFIGFQNQCELPAVFAASDVCVMPSSRDAWGLAINEAMAAGLPVIVSNQVGAAPDLVAGKGTGVVAPCGDIDALGEALAGLVNDPMRRQVMGQKARLLIANWDNGVCATHLAEAARAVCVS